MGPSGLSNKSSEIVRLVETVEQLADADQDRILKIVSLLTCVPASVQRNTQRMLKNLLDADPGSILECLEGVDEVIDYLEREAIANGRAAALFDALEYVSGSGRPN